MKSGRRNEEMLMPAEKINEKIKAGVVFGASGPVPRWFTWRKKKILVTSVNYKWKSTDGKSVLLHFAVSADSGNYEISFNRDSMEWKLLKSEIL